MTIKIQSVWDCGIGIDDITCEDIHLASVAGMDDITCDDLIYGDVNQECVILWYWDWWYNVWWYHIWRSTSCKLG